MDVASIYYLGITILLFLVFLAIVVYTYSGDRKARGEEAKYRMMDED
jgi:cbb3-type cytochrome oxidase subunit 3